MRRVLVTGSRRFSDRPVLFRRLFEELEQSPDGIVIVHGKNPKGADRMASQFFQAFCKAGVEEDPHPADWNRECDKDCFHALRLRENGRPWCPRAGSLRNQEMVDLGAYRCLALPLQGSIGTWDCVNRARAAKIPLSVYDAEQGKWLEEQ